MSLIDAAGTATATGENSSNPGTTAEKSVDQLNQDFQRSNGGEHANTVITKTGENKEGSGWFYDDNMPGTGDRPEFLKEKYKSVTEQAKAYNELDKKLGTFKGAPETYDTALPDMPDFKFEEGDPMLTEFLDLAKKSNASQEFVTQALSQYVKSQQFYAPDPAAELEKIGLNAKQDIAHLSEWASQRLDDKEFVIFKSLVTTADAFNVMQKLRRSLTSKPEIAVDKAGDKTGSQPQLNERQLLEMIADPRYSTDPLFRQEVDAKAQRVWG